MSSAVPIRRAVLSVSDKTDLVPFARSLVEIGAEIISTGGTARTLVEAGIDVLPIDQVTGVPEMMDGRVKTLHPTIHGALLGRRDNDAHMASMKEHDIVPIDLVCVNLYPFEHTILKEGITDNEAIEQIDIGGPSMLRSAAKNHEFVTVVTDPNQYDKVINDLRANDGASSAELRRELAAAAFTRTAEYDTAISAWMSGTRDRPFPSMLQNSYALQSELRYGENPHQRAALYLNPASGEPSIVRAEQLSGKELSYNNIHDAAAALELVRDLTEAFPNRVAAAIIKHTNPCGCGLADDPATAFTRAYEGDSLAAFGGILAINRTIDEATAAEICDGQKFLELIIAPGYDDAARTMLTERWKNARLLLVPGFERSSGMKMDAKTIPGGLLMQQRDLHLPKIRDWHLAAGDAPDDKLFEDAAFTWLVAKHLKSNAIAIAADGQLLGVGCGQVDRVAACRHAVEKAGERVRTASTPVVAASDAFFPFDDGPRTLIDAGVTCIVHPGGSKRDEDTFELCREKNVRCLTTGIRHFRH